MFRMYPHKNKSLAARTKSSTALCSFTGRLGKFIRTTVQRVMQWPYGSVENLVASETKQSPERVIREFTSALERHTSYSQNFSDK